MQTIDRIVILELTSSLSFEGVKDFIHPVYKFTNTISSEKEIRRRIGTAMEDPYFLERDSKLVQILVFPMFLYDVEKWRSKILTTNTLMLSKYGQKLLRIP